MNRIPAIRFKGFTDPWEQRKFSDFVVASGIKNRENLPLQSYSVSNDRGFVPQDEQFENGGTMRDADKSMYWIVEPGSFAYNPARINVGSIGYLSTSENVIVSSLYEVFRADESCDDRFLWHWFKSPLFMKQIEMLQEGGVRLYFFFDKLLLSEIWMPSVEEQRLIGAHFDRLDSLITLHQRKHDQLSVLKKGLLEKMFPRDGTLVPEIRFKGFTDPWEQRKFSELYQLNNERNVNEEFGYDRTLSIATMTFNGGNGAADSSLDTYKVIRVGDIAFEGHANKVHAYGRFVLNDAGNGLMSPRFSCLRPTTEQYFPFWKHFIPNERMMRPILVNATKSGTMMNELVVPDLMGQSIPVPSLPEQRVIGDCLASLDNLITLHQRKLELLKNLKAACLEKMFV